MAQQIGKVITDPAVNQARLYDANDTWVANSTLVESGNGGLKTIKFLDVPLADYRMDLYEGSLYVATLPVVTVKATTWEVPIDASTATVLSEVKKIPRAVDELNGGDTFKVVEGSNETSAISIVKTT